MDDADETGFEPEAEETGLGAAETDGLGELEPAPEASGRELEDIEYDGQVYQAPKALKEAVMRHADYTRKTQDLAAERRAFEAERDQAAEMLETRAGLSALDQKIAAI